MSPRVAIFTIFVAFASATDEEMWGPSDSAKAFGAIEAALKKVTSLPMSPAESQKAHKIADEVRNTITLVESSTNMTKAQRNQKVAGIMKELQGLAMDLKSAKLAESTDSTKIEHLKELKAELAEKKKELQKDEAMIKLYTLQKELAEKKLQLQKLIEKKNQDKTSKEAMAEDAKAESVLVGKLMKMTGDLAKVSDKKAELPAPLKSALTEVKAFAKKESDELTKVEKNNKQMMATLDAQMKMSVPTKGKDDALAKGQQMMRRLKKEEHRKFMKFQVQKKAQLAELKTIEQSIEQHDAKKLTGVLQKMQHEAKAAAAKSGDFLH